MDFWIRTGRVRDALHVAKLPKKKPFLVFAGSQKFGIIVAAAGFLKHQSWSCIQNYFVILNNDH
jgi:hypothetical protein